MMTTSKCRSCGADILWLKNVNTGRLSPVDALPSEKGNTAIGEQTCTVLAGEALDAARKALKPLHLNHFVTCPNAKIHRKEAAK